MKIAVQGIFTTDLSEITYERVRFATELGFKGFGAHITVPAEHIPQSRIDTARARLADQDMALLQLWGAYPSIISPDARVRQAGVAQVHEICKVCAQLGAPGVGVRPTSMNPRGDWWPHADNYLPETEDRLVHSLNEILVVARDLGLRLVLECHQTSTLDSPTTIRRVIERTDPAQVRVNLDPCNFISDLRTAFHPQAMLRACFDILGKFADTVHLKDYYLEDRFVVHISETILGTGLMDWHTLLTLAHINQPDGWLMIEHLPVSQIAQAKQNLNQLIAQCQPISPIPSS